MTQETAKSIEEKDITKKDKRSRLLEIVRIIRKYDVLRNFIRQKNPRQVCLALEELGPTFIKAGQILSTRPDLVSPEYITELKHLQDQVHVDSFDTVSQTFETQTGKKIDEVFSYFETTPFASASIGQTHRAILDGKSVVVKIQHPNIKQLVITDLALFRKSLAILKFVPDLTSVINAEDTIQEIKTALLNEINTNIEITNGEKFYYLNNNNDIIRVPYVYKKYSTQKILVNEAMDGKSIKYLLNEPLSHNKKEAKKQRAERQYVAKVLVQNFIKQVFVDDFFHADPHPGNILFYRLTDKQQAQALKYKKTHLFEYSIGNSEFEVGTKKPMPPIRLVYLDFGMMGQLTPELISGISQVIFALYSKDARKIGQAVLGICNRTGEIDDEKFYFELGNFIAPYLQMGVGQIDFPTMLFEVIALCRKNNLQIKPEVTLLIKAFGSIEDIVAQLDPELSMMDIVRPFVVQYLKDKFNVKSFMQDNLWTLSQASFAIPQIPIKTSQFLDILNQGQARVTFKLRNQDRIVKSLLRAINRLIIVILLAAVILGSSLLVQGSSEHPAIYNIGVTGYIVSVIVILVLIILGIYDKFHDK